MNETDIKNLVLLEAGRKNIRLWRNNVGATYTMNKNFIRYGLANESEQMNKQLKSSDLIGIRPVLIVQEMVGLTIGQFLAREIKTTDWKYKNTEREQAQLRWINLINSLGGDACFAIGEDTL